MPHLQVIALCVGMLSGVVSAWGIRVTQQLAVLSNVSSWFADEAWGCTPHLESWLVLHLLHVQCLAFFHACLILCCVALMAAAGQGDLRRTVAPESAPAAEHGGRSGPGAC